MIRAAAILALILFVISFLIGCKEEDEPIPPRPPWWGVGTVQIITTDTLRFVPGDSASTPVTIIVVNRDGRVMPGRKVSVALTNPHLGFLEFVDPELQDTTNDFGRVSLIFTSVTQPGIDTILAICEGVQAEPRPIVIVQSCRVCNITFRFSRDFEHFDSDSIGVSLLLSDCAGNGVGGISVAVQPSRGYISDVLPTDVGGYAHFWWWPLPELEDACLYYQVESIADTVCL